MQYFELGGDVKAARICLGVMGFADSTRGIHTWTLNEEDSFTIMQRAVEGGINFFDTAMAYGGGSSEEYLGRMLRKPGKRDDFVVATKYSPKTQEEIDKGVSGQEHIMNCLDASLERLGMDYVDLYICHQWDENTPMEEMMEGLHQAVTAGKVRHIGISNCFAWQLAECNDYAREYGLTGFVSMQGHYNLIHREEEREMIPYTLHKGMAYTPYSSLAAGRLSRLPGTKTKRMMKDWYASGKYDKVIKQDNLIINRVYDMAEKYGVSMTEIALAWLLTKIEAPICGATKEHHINALLSCMDVHLSADDIAYLEECYVPRELVGVMAGK